MNSKQGRIFVALAAILLIALTLIFPLSAQEATPDPSEGVSYTIEQVVVANFPVVMAFAPDGRLFYNERTTGNVRVVNADGTSQIEPVIHLDTDILVERGLIGLTLDPGYAENGTIWVVHTRPGTASDWPANEVVRFHEENGVGTDPQVMLSVPITNGELQHNGGNLYFDADGLLYVSFGDYGDATNSQNMETMMGKIHRFHVTGLGLLPAEGNPFPGSSIYVYGVRNTFDFTFDPVTGAMFGSENGNHCDDEINRILPGKNYGWSLDYLDKCYGFEPVDVPDYMPPLLSYTPTISPTGIMVYRGDAFPAWDGDIFFCAFNTGVMTQVVLNETQDAVIAVAPFDLQGLFCRTDVVVGPEGAIYIADFGAIYRIVPS